MYLLFGSMLKIKLTISRFSAHINIPHIVSYRLVSSIVHRSVARVAR